MTSIVAVKPYSPLELEGRDIYIREGCYNCHSQMIRPIRAETARYGDYSKAGEFVYDHPFQFGSKRTGPDLHRIGGKYPDLWHYNHMLDPRSTTADSIMPSYNWLITDTLDTSLTATKVGAMRTLGVPYSDQDVDQALDSLRKQQKKIGDSLRADKIDGADDKEIVALIAYLQRLGTDTQVKAAAAASN